MSSFKRILFFGKPSKKQIDELALDLFEDGCYGRITAPGRVEAVLKAAQAAGFKCKFIIIDERQFAAWGMISGDIITGLSN
jgi:hypothetical protein